MVYSLSEIDANCKKAARGAGLSWGYAEEAGKAARWLAAHQLPGAALLAEYLTLRQENPQDYQGTSLRCPLLTGAILCDSGLPEIGESNALGHVAYPLLLLPYIAQLSQASQVSLCLQWSSTQIFCTGGAIRVKEDEPIVANEATNVSYFCLQSDAAASTNNSYVREAGAVGQFIESNHWSALEVLAHLTYVPATEESRRGAGPA